MICQIPESQTKLASSKHRLDVDAEIKRGKEAMKRRQGEKRCPEDSTKSGPTDLTNQIKSNQIKASKPHENERLDLRVRGSKRQERESHQH
jgi:hypothetical protein